MRNMVTRMWSTWWKGCLLMPMCLTGSILVAEAQQNIVDIHNIGYRDWEMESFSLEKAIELRIEARGASNEWSEFMYAYAWMLNGRSRDVVWEMDFDNTSSRRRRNELEYEGNITLPPGDYEVYFAIAPFSFEKIKVEGLEGLEGLGDLFKNIFRNIRDKNYSKDWGITIGVVHEKDMKHVHHQGITRQDRNVIIQMVGLGDDEFRKEGFGLQRSTLVHIYAIGEGARDDREMYDYGWIIDARTRERVWEMTSRNTRHAGGADKNLIYNDQITLPAGNYLVHYVTDGSHSCDSWNARPPYDPTYWGITLWAEDPGFSPQDVVSYVESREEKPIIDLSRMRNDEFVSQGFTLLKPAELRIRALGEYSSGEFYDYGMILNATTRQKAWAMTRDNTTHAGGAEKNRVFDGLITLPAGDYIAYYISDDSHSYLDWNSGPPYDPEAWGITIWITGESTSQNIVREYREREDSDILANLTGLGDKEKESASFTLRERTELRIYAIGEGDRDEMYDYGWIENDRGKVCWEMTYRNTEHAGGARKNRLFNDTIILDRGEYEVHFVTDGSHSFSKWNANPPDDPFHWGIMVMREE